MAPPDSPRDPQGDAHDLGHDDHHVLPHPADARQPGRAQDRRADPVLQRRDQLRGRSRDRLEPLRDRSERAAPRAVPLVHVEPHPSGHRQVVPVIRDERHVHHPRGAPVDALLRGHRAAPELHRGHRPRAARGVPSQLAPRSSDLDRRFSGELGPQLPRRDHAHPVPRGAGPHHQLHGHARGLQSRLAAGALSGVRRRHLLPRGDADHHLLPHPDRAMDPLDAKRDALGSRGGLHHRRACPRPDGRAHPHRVCGAQRGAAARDAARDQRRLHRRRRGDHRADLRLSGRRPSSAGRGAAARLPGDPGNRPPDDDLGGRGEPRRRWRQRSPCRTRFGAAG